jgi:hypothetical protein
MKNIDQILREKQSRMEQLRSEIQALRIVAPLVSETGAAETKPLLSPSVAPADDLGLYLDEPAN